MSGTYEIQYADGTIFNVTEPDELKELLLENNQNRIRILDILILNNATTIKLKYDDSSNSYALNYLISAENLESIPVLKEKFTNLKPTSSGNRFLYRLMLLLMVAFPAGSIAAGYFMAGGPFARTLTFIVIYSILVTLFILGLPYLVLRYYPALLLLDDKGNIFNGWSVKRHWWPFLSLIVIPIVIDIVFHAI